MEENNFRCTVTRNEPKFKSNVFLNSLNTAISISDEATNLIEFKIWLTKIKSKSLSYLIY